MTIPDRDCPVLMDGYMAEIKNYGRLAGSRLLADLVSMTATFGLPPDSDRVRYYRHVKWADGREWTGRVHDLRSEIANDVLFHKALRPLRRSA